jgi:hypothetical protein
VPEEHPDKVVAALKRFHPMEVRRMVSQITPFQSDIDRVHRYSTTGTPIHMPRQARLGGSQVSLPSIRRSFRVGTATSSSLRPTGHTAGGRQLTALSSKGFSMPWKQSESFVG